MKRYKTVNEYIECSDSCRGVGTIEENPAFHQTRRNGKMGMPCYTLDGKMLVGLGAFKSFVALWFFQERF